MIIIKNESQQKQSLQEEMEERFKHPPVVEQKHDRLETINQLVEKWCQSQKKTDETAFGFLEAAYDAGFLEGVYEEKNRRKKDGVSKNTER